MLVVEDDIAVRFAMTDYLSARGFDVASTATLEHALELLDERVRDVLIADLRLTGTDSEDGLSVAAYALDHRRATHVLLLTAYGFDRTVMRAAKLGVTAVLNKPMPLAELAALIDELCARPNPEEE